VQADVAMFIMLAALLLGLGAGWLMGRQPLAALRADRDRRLDEFRRAITELAAAEERARAVPLLQQSIDDLRAERDMARTEVATLSADARMREQMHADRMQELRDARDALAAQFSEVGAKLLGEAQTAFLQRADERFRQAGEDNESKIKAVLQPVELSLKRYEEGVAKVEDERRKEQGNLTGLIESMRTGQEAVRSEAAKLVNALRAAPKARGRWGEQQLRNVLESCGLSEHADFQTEVSLNGEAGRMRPDVIIRVPGGGALVVDAKVSLNAYQDAFEAVDDREKKVHLIAHAAAMKAHVNGLGNKSYWDQVPEATDYVIMFVPGEHFLSAALENDPALWDFAFEKRVLLATPTNLIAIARTVAAVWRQERLASEAKVIGTLGKEMYDRLASATVHLKRVGSGLNSAVDNYNKFVSSFESRVLVSARRFRDLNIETGAREIEAMEPVESLARDITPELPAPSEGSAEAQGRAEAAE
jgi:DNA recombination protein RmuC